MRILAIDVGTGTQDILLFDSDRPVENCVKMVLPSPTEIAARRIRRATRDAVPLVLTGTVAGGGPSSWALEDHLRAGLAAYATPEAAQTVDDDLARVQELGVRIVSEDEARSLAAEQVELGDLDIGAIRAVLALFEEPGDFDGIAVGCLDHGAAPPGVSDRTFRFEHLRGVVAAENDLLAFAFAPGALPSYLTRARAVAAVAAREAPTAFMDTGPAAALGALHDEHVAVAGDERVVLNLGNMHLLGFHLRGRAIASLFEHHTGELTRDQIAAFTHRLADGDLTNEEVFGSQGHGAYHADRSLVNAGMPGMIAVTGPQRDKLRGAGLTPYFAAPFGDMMISGCFGLLRGFGRVHPASSDSINHRLGVL
ncbi:MAG TPA: DUF1786 family protein [Tepidiformaceae bacterium]|nr:DUF1786 family protein [Tepidiformaceae bacterium]